METVASWFVQAFRRQADHLAGLYGSRIWLVGSSLVKEHPRDIDLRVTLSDFEMQRRYGHKFPELDIQGNQFAHWQWRRSQDCVKQSRQLLNWGGFPIDFQVQSESEADRYKDKERVRLDSAPDWFFLC